MIAIMTSTRTGERRHPARKLAVTLLLSIALFLCFELALQIRSHIRHGQSVFNVFTAETRYVFNDEIGLNTLRPNHTFKAAKIEITTNSLGLRSPEIETIKPQNTIRIAVIGASTVMGAYAESNSDTFSYQLESMLNQGSRTYKYEVINAGIAGYGLSDQARMIEKVLTPLTPDIIIAYPGFNDFGSYCRDEQALNSSERRRQRSGLPTLSTPAWLLSIELIQKNTVELRTPPATNNSFRSTDSLDVTPYQQKLDSLVLAAKQTGAKLLLATNARAYRPEQPADLQTKLSETARYYNPCFDLEGLNKLYDIHNGAIVDTAIKNKIALVPLGNLIPGGREYFVDSSHFSKNGEYLAAKHLYLFLTENNMVPKG